MAIILYIVGEEQTTIVVKIQPNASQNKVVRFEDGVLYLRIAAPPVKGKANQELIKFLSDRLQVNRSNLTIGKGVTAKRKLIVVKGLTQDQVMKRISESST